MPLVILYGGEIVFIVLGIRIAWWIWRSRGQIRVLLSPPPDGDGVPSQRPRAAVMDLTATGREDRSSVRRAA